MSGAASTSPPPTVPTRSARLLGFVRKLIDYGRQLYTALQERTADIAAVTRDSTGTVIAGSMEDAIATHESWTFEKDLRSRAPDWMLVGTDEG